jgi:hypothetical protein
MTTDELRAWMKALEERDVRIVALEKQVQVLQLRDAEQAPAQADVPLDSPEAKAAMLRTYAECATPFEAKRKHWAPEDAHATAAAEMFGIPREQVTQRQRDEAKALTFSTRVWRAAGRV